MNRFIWLAIFFDLKSKSMEATTNDEKIKKRRQIWFKQSCKSSKF